MFDEGFLITFPSHTLWSKTDKTPLISRIGEKKVIPIFTDLDSAKTFVERANKPCIVSDFPSAAELKKFLMEFKKTDLIDFDPISYEGLRERLLYTVEQVLGSLDDE
jgi:5'-3' exonuclease